MNQSLADIEHLERVWSNILCKCYNKNNYLYVWYGKKGVRICKQWKNNKLRFIKYCLRHGYQGGLGLQINRIDNTDGYREGNINFVSQTRNLGNRKTKGMVGFRNRIDKSPMNIQFSKGKYGVLFNREGIRYYIGRYYTVEEAVAARDKAIKRVEQRLYGNKSRTN